jgi:hypothetical protein
MGVLGFGAGSLAVFVVAVGLFSCGGAEDVEDRVVERGSAARPPFEGPLVDAAAVTALECDGEAPYEHGKGEYGDGLATVQDSAEAALDDYMREAGLSFITPPEGYAVEKKGQSRVLLSYDVDGRSRVAVLLADDVGDWSGSRGWGVRTWAVCDPSELPPAVTDDLNIGVWEDQAGRRTPVTRIHSFQGSDHCGWEDITFVVVGPERTADWYVSDTHGEFLDYLRTTFSNDTALPHAAVDTGLRRDGRQLWVTPDKTAAYLVSVDDPNDVQRWPAAKQPIRCA